MDIFEVNIAEKIGAGFVIGVKMVKGNPSSDVGTILLDIESGVKWKIIGNASLPPDSLALGLKAFMVKSETEDAIIKIGCKLQGL